MDCIQHISWGYCFVLTFKCHIPSVKKRSVCSYAYLKIFQVDMKIFCRSNFLFLEGCILLSRVHVSEAFESLLCKKKSLYLFIYSLFVILILQINKVIQKEKKHRALVDDFVEFWNALHVFFKLRRSRWSARAAGFKGWPQTLQLHIEHRIRFPSTPAEGEPFQPARATA